MGFRAAVSGAACPGALRARARAQPGGDVRHPGGQRSGWGLLGGVQAGEGAAAESAPERPAALRAGAMAGAHEAAPQGYVDK